MPTKSYAHTMESVAAIRKLAAEWKEEEAALMADRAFSDEWKAARRTARRQIHADAAELAITRIWKRAQERVSQAQAELQASAAQFDVDDKATAEQLRWKRDEYLTALRRPETLADNRLKRARQMLADAVTDTQRRALTQALAEAGLLDQVELSDVRQQVRAWDEARQAPLRQAQVELKHAQLGLDEIKRAALAVEPELTNHTPNSFAPALTPWSKALFGDDAQSLGYVVIRGEFDDAEATAGEPLATGIP